jgi:hypothetical protein
MEYLVAQIQEKQVILARLDGQAVHWPYFVAIKGEANQLLPAELVIGQTVVLRDFEWDERFRNLAASMEEATPKRRCWYNGNTGLLAVQATTRNWRIVHNPAQEEVEGEIVEVKLKGWGLEVRYVMVDSARSACRVGLIQRQCAFGLGLAREGDDCRLGLVRLPAGILINSWAILPTSFPFTWDPTKFHTSTNESSLIVCMNS